MSKKLPATHPGEILPEEFMKPTGLSSSALGDSHYAGAPCNGLS